MLIVESGSLRLNPGFIHEVIFSIEESPELLATFLDLPCESVDEEYLVGMRSRAGIVIGKKRLTPSDCSLNHSTSLRALFNLS